MSGDRGVGVARGLGCCYCVAAAGDVVLRFARRGRSGALIALLLGSRRPVWSVVASSVGAIPGTVLLVQGGRALLGVLGIVNGAAAVFFFVLAGLLVLPLVKLVLPTGSTVSSAKSIMRQRGFLVPMGRWP
jgi:hypothetical protein